MAQHPVLLRGAALPADPFRVLLSLPIYRPTALEDLIPEAFTLLPWSLQFTLLTVGSEIFGGKIFIYAAAVSLPPPGTFYSAGTGFDLLGQ